LQIQGAACGDEHQFGRHLTARQCRDEIHRGVIDPLEIFENQQQRTFCGDSLQRLADFTQHSLTRGAQDLPLQHLTVFALEQRRN